MSAAYRPTAAQIDAEGTRQSKMTPRRRKEWRATLATSSRGRALIAAVDTRQRAASKPTTALTPQGAAATAARSEPAPAAAAPLSKVDEVFELRGIKRPAASPNDDPDGAESVALARKLGVLPAKRSPGAAKIDEIFELRSVKAKPADATSDPDGGDTIALARKIGLHGVRPEGEPS